MVAVVLAIALLLNTMIVTHAYGLDLRLTASAVAWSTAITVTTAVLVSAFA